MEDLRELKFYTKTGYCIVTSQRIALKRDGVVGRAAQGIYGDSINRPLLIYTVLGLAAISYGIWSIVDHGNFIGGIFILIGAFFLWSVFLGRHNSGTNVIERSSVQFVEPHSPIPFLTRGYFVICFLENGKKLKRIIMLPGSLSGGNTEYKKALVILKEMGWYNA